MLCKRGWLRVLMVAGTGVAVIAVGVIAGNTSATAAVRPLTLYQRSGRAPLVVWGKVLDGVHKKAVIRTLDIVKCTIAERPGETFLVAYKLDSFLRKPWEDKISFAADDEVVLFLRKFTKEDGRQPEGDLYTLMWGAQGKFSLPPEGAQAYVAAVRSFVQVLSHSDPDRQAAMLIKSLHNENPYMVDGAFEEVLRQDLGDLDLVPDLIGFFDNPRDSFRIQSMRVMEQILSDAAIAGRQVPRVDELADRVRGRAVLDESAPFRVAAVEVLSVLGDDASRTLLQHLSQEDPDQDVRYAAEKALLGWNRHH